MFLAYTNDPACYYQLAITSSDTNTLQVTMWPTGIGTNYQIYSKDLSVSNSAWRVEQSFVGTGGSTTVTISINGRDLSLIGGYAEDDDGDELPTGYEVLATLTNPFLPDTGLTGTPDGYKDPDGDGYVNLAEYQNGTDPHVFNAPLGPINATLDYNATNTVTVTWEPAAGAVTGYIISAYDTNGNLVTLATNSSTDLSYSLSNPAYFGFTLAPQFPSVQFLVTAIYSQGLSLPVAGTAPQIPAAAQSALVNGPGGQVYLLTSALNTNLAAYAVSETVDQWQYPLDPNSFGYGGLWPPYDAPWITLDYTLPVSQFTNNITVLSSNQAPAYSWLSSGGVTPILSGNTPAAYSDGSSAPMALPFLDSSAIMKQNIRFLLRAANDAPFGYFTTNQFGYGYTYPEDHVYEGIWSDVAPTGIDPFQPSEDNYLFANFVFNAGLLGSGGDLNNGFYPAYDDDGGPGQITQYDNPAFEFSTIDYISSSNQAPFQGILPADATPVGYNWGDLNSSSPAYIGQYGAYESGSELHFAGGTNIYGLPYESLQVTITNATGFHSANLLPGGEVSGFSPGPVFVGTAQPELQTVDYYFGLSGPNWYDLQPSDDAFTVTNPTPSLMLGAVGVPTLVEGWAKQAILNGSPNAFAYLGQFFTNAFAVSNGVPTTNATGILSEYGQFFPTIPGQVELVTKPDPDQTNIQGTCQLDIIRLSLDVNHDGVMDESFTGPDNTGYFTPYIFWANNDYDRYIGTNEEDLQTAVTPDCDYAVNGNRCIPCPRDLEDYARLWASGVSNTLSRLSSGSTVTLSWGDVGNPDNNGNNPTIDLFQAADADGGVGYLTNLTTASNQINTNLCQYIGRLGPGSNLTLNASTFSGGWAGDHYIFCGVGYGSGTLYLTVADGSGNTLAQSSQSIQIVDIKQMYERWTIGEDPATPPAAPMEVAQLVNDGLPIPGQPPSHYTYDPSYDTNDDYIVFVHGWDMPGWKKDRFAETVYKRLYWQGYQGRFGSFRWPCNLLNPLALMMLQFNQVNLGEWTAWQCGQPFEDFLASLNNRYPNKVYVLAHSMGNVVTGEALRLAGTNVIVNTYVATQAAVSARAYDNTVPADATNSYTPHVITPDSEGHYYTSGAPPYFNGIGGALNFVDYYNPVDYVLGYWVTDQNLKADSSSYLYTTPSPQFPSGYYNRASFFTTRSLVFPANTYEIFSMADQSYSFALGAETNIANSFSFRSSVNLQLSPYDFGRLPTGHSFEFHADNMTVGVYWKQLLSSFGITQ